jgi:two-component system sensor histidine kinase TctE
MATHSIRRDLLAKLIAPLALVTVLAGALAFVVARQFSASVLDQWLYDAATSIVGRVQWTAAGPRLDVPAVGAGGDSDPVDRFFYEALAPDGRRVGGNATLPAAPNRPLPGGARQLYFATVNDVPVRVLAVALRRDGNVVIVRVAETVQRRTTLARQLLWMGLALSIVLAVGSAGVVWYGIGRGIGAIERAMRRTRDPDARASLAPLTVTAETPVEVVPLVAQINSLLADLAAAHSVNERFIVNAAHQLRTPVATLRVQLEAAGREQDPRRRAGHVDAAVQVVAHMSRVLHQLLTLARADDSANARADGQSVDLDLIARDEVERRVDEAMALGVDLGYDGPGGPVVVEASDDLVREALANLIDNALRYGGAGGTVTVGIRGGPMPELYVDDRGPGIPVEERSRVTDRFYRMPGTGGDGCGLGLAIVDEIARISGASLRLETGSSGTGLRASLRFGAAVSATPRTAPARSSAPAGSARAGGSRSRSAA